MSLTSYRAAPPRAGGGAGEWGWLVDLAATYSPTSWDAVPWALRGFTAEFGMGSGGAPALSATRSTNHPTPPPPPRGRRGEQGGRRPRLERCGGGGGGLASRSAWAVLGWRGCGCR